MNLFLCEYPVINLSTISQFSQIIIALANLFLAGYIFLYKRRKDIKTDFNTARLHEQSIKLQWFKEIIIQPRMSIIESFYKNLNDIYTKFNCNDLTLAEKEDINNIVKNQSAEFRKKFIDVLLHIDNSFAKIIQDNLDELVDGITNAIFNEELKLKLPAVYDKYIGSKISYSYNNLMSSLYNYKGLSE